MESQIVHSSCCKVFPHRNTVEFTLFPTDGYLDGLGFLVIPTALFLLQMQGSPSADLYMLALIATRCRGFLPVRSMLHSLVWDLIVAEHFHSVLEYGHTCLVLKPGCVFIYFKKNHDYVVWNGGEMCQVRQASLMQFLVRFGCSVHVELYSAVRSQWLWWEHPFWVLREPVSKDYSGYSKAFS